MNKGTVRNLSKRHRHFERSREIFVVARERYRFWADASASLGMTSAFDPHLKGDQGGCSF